MSMMVMRKCCCTQFHGFVNKLMRREFEEEAKEEKKQDVEGIFEV